MTPSDLLDEAQTSLAGLSDTVPCPPAGQPPPSTLSPPLPGTPLTFLSTLACSCLPTQCFIYSFPDRYWAPAVFRGRGYTANKILSQPQGVESGRKEIDLHAVKIWLPWISSLNVQYWFWYFFRSRNAFILAKSSNWIRQFMPYL